MEIKPLAFYLPQYHPIPENNTWWGEGFTEWTNVKKGKPLFKGHYQPLKPTVQGYYDLRMPDVRDRQVAMAREHGVYGFIYYQYWFGKGKKLLETIAEEVLESEKPDFPFCFCWANESWTGVWHGLNKKILAEQTYPGEEDVKEHIEYLAPFFKDSRYIKVDGKPLFMIYDPTYIPDIANYIGLYRKHAKRHGFADLFIVGSSKSKDSLPYKQMGFDAHISNAFHVSFDKEIRRWKYRWSILSKVLRKYLGPTRVSAKQVFDNMQIVDSDVETYPMVLPNWDNTPRSAKRGVVLEDATPELFEGELRKAKGYLEGKDDYQEKFLIIKSWNEWAEGNILEPEERYGYGFLERIRKVLGKHIKED